MGKLILFDLDGTFMDTSEGVLHSIISTMEQMGMPIQDTESLGRYIGPPIEYSFQHYAGMSGEAAGKAAKIFREIYPQKYLFQAKVYPGLAGLLDTLRGLHVKSGIATFKRESYTLELLKHFGLFDHFDIVHGSDSLGKLTKSDIIDACIRETGLDADHVIMVGDTVHDASAAAVSGVDFIAVTYGYGFKSSEEIGKNPYRKICESPAELVEYILSVCI